MKKINPDADYLEKLPTPLELKKELPLTFEKAEFIEEQRSLISKILDREDPRLLLILGPCSIHDFASAIEFAAKLKAFSEEVADTFTILMRVYFEKPRTTTGWKGFLNDPYLDGSCAIADGLRLTRRLLLELIQLQIPAAAEILDPISGLYLSDLIAWGCIGARTAESQIHRQMASGLPMPIAFKNNTNGSIEAAVNGALAASLPHNFASLNEQGYLYHTRTEGNRNCHIVLRGGHEVPNYTSPYIEKALRLMKIAGLTPKLLIDCSHDNSNRQHEKQIEIFQSVLQQFLKGENRIRGLLLESHLFAGSQPLANPKQLKYGVSITDPCLDLETTFHLIRQGRQMISKEKVRHYVNI
jgi:3-deoxy-7-phosphoheptulonate synthase